MVEDKIITEEICPYATCVGKINLQKTGSLFGYCEKCRYPVFICGHCNTINRSFARFCRECGKEVSFPDTSLNNLQFTPDKFEQTSRIIGLEEFFIAAPKSYKGFLWFLSESGKVYAISPYAENPFCIGSLGPEFGNSPFLITELTTHQIPYLIPYLISISSHSIKGLNLLTMSSMEFLSLPSSSPEEIICDRTETFCSIVEKNNKLYFLKRDTQNQNISICQLDLADKKLTSFELNETGVAGPIKVSNYIIAYSKNKIFLVFENAEFKSYDVPPGFTPCLSNNDFQGLYPAPGNPPYMVSGNSFYLQGIFRNKPHFLYIDFGAPTISQVFILTPPGVYGLSPSGNPVFVSRGRIDELMASGLVNIQSDGEITGQNTPFYASPLAVAFAQNSVGATLIRFFWRRSNEVSNFNVGRLNDFLTAMGFFLHSGTIALVYIRERRKVGVAIWDL